MTDAKRYAGTDDTGRFEMRVGQIVAYKRSGCCGFYEARIKAFSGGRVVLAVLKLPGAMERHEPGWRACVKPNRIVKLVEDVQS